MTEPLALTRTAGGWHLRLRVTPKAKTEGLRGLHAGALKVFVRAAPERGKANAAVVALLAKALDVPKSNVTIVAGTTSRQKTVCLPLAVTEAAIHALALGT